MAARLSATYRAARRNRARSLRLLKAWRAGHPAAEMLKIDHPRRYRVPHNWRPYRGRYAMLDELRSVMRKLGFAA